MNSQTQVYTFGRDLIQSNQTYAALTWGEYQGASYRALFDPVLDLAYCATHGILTHPLFPAGTEVSYSDTDYMLLGLIITAVDREPIESVIRNYEGLVKFQMCEF